MKSLKIFQILIVMIAFLPSAFLNESSGKKLTFTEISNEIRNPVGINFVLSPLFIVKPNDTSSIEGEQKIIKWQAVVVKATNYTILDNKSLIRTNVWLSGNFIELDLAILESGIHNITIILRSEFAKPSSDSIIAQINPQNKMTEIEISSTRNLPFLDLNFFMIFLFVLIASYIAFLKRKKTK